MRNTCRYCISQNRATLSNPNRQQLLSKHSRRLVGIYCATLMLTTLPAVVSPFSSKHLNLHHEPQRQRTVSLVSSKSEGHFLSNDEFQFRIKFPKPERKGSSTYQAALEDLDVNSELGKNIKTQKQQISKTNSISKTRDKSPTQSLSNARTDSEGDYNSWLNRMSTGKRVSSTPRSSPPSPSVYTPNESWVSTGKRIIANKPLRSNSADNFRSRIRHYFKKNREYRGNNSIEFREPYELGGLPRLQRYSSKDWLHNTLNIQSSAILHQIRGPILAMSAWATFVSVVHLGLKRMFGPSSRAAARLCLPSTAPHSLLVSSLGLLLVFRTNSAYQRFAEGVKIWERILSTSRDFARLMKLYEHDIGGGRRERVTKLLAAFPYLLRHRIRPNLVLRDVMDPTVKRDEHSLLLYNDLATTDEDEESLAVAEQEETRHATPAPASHKSDAVNQAAKTNKHRRQKTPRQLYWVDKRTLPWRLLPPNAMQDCARAQNRPLWVCDRMAAELVVVPNSETFTSRERLLLLGKVEKLSQAIGECERIHQTVVPLNYARHALRSLAVWLFSLPFALVKDLGLLTGPTLAIMSWLLFGVYEIGYSIEDPFQGTLRLSILCDGIRRDVLGDELNKNSAYELPEEVVPTKQQTTAPTSTSTSTSTTTTQDHATLSATPASSVTTQKPETGAAATPHAQPHAVNGDDRNKPSVQVTPSIRTPPQDLEFIPTKIDAFFHDADRTNENHDSWVIERIQSEPLHHHQHHNL
mmetsp:Transcript_6792/g.8361  ORF Transcript_6792/g.8361 Transcript_6792/m.8361 type:complete len:752 (-) Transcript_6792:538-2793(-)